MTSDANEEIQSSAPGAAARDVIRTVCPPPPAV